MVASNARMGPYPQNVWYLAQSGTPREGGTVFRVWGGGAQKLPSACDSGLPLEGLGFGLLSWRPSFGGKMR